MTQIGFSTADDTDDTDKASFGNNRSVFVIPAKAGIHRAPLDSRFRGNDELIQLFPNRPQGFASLEEGTLSSHPRITLCLMPAFFLPGL
jgi:hypothetical protein